MKIENIEQQQKLELNYLYENDGYITFEIIGINEYFSGKGHICVSRNNLSKFINSIDDLKLEQSEKIQDYDSDSYIHLYKIDNLGHYKLKYQIGGTHQDNFCQLTLNTDLVGINNIKYLLAEI